MSILSIITLTMPKNLILVIGKISKFNLYTTGKILRGVYMPKGALSS